MGDTVSIDKSLARGAFRTELRNSGDVMHPVIPPDGILAPDSDFDSFFLKTVGETLSRKISFKPESYRGIARTISHYRVAPTERLYALKTRVLPGSSRRSHIEASFLNRPIFLNDRIGSFCSYLFLQKDRLVHGNRLFCVSQSGHAIRRYLQRGDGISLSERNVAAILVDTIGRAGLFAFLTCLTERKDGMQFPVPYKGGLFLCEIETYPNGLEMTFFHPGGGDVGVSGPASEHSHPLNLTDGRRERIHCCVKTFIGRREMHAGQAALCDMIEGVYGRYRREIDLIAGLEGVFHARQDITLYQALNAAGPALDAAAAEIAAALRSDSELCYAFYRSREFPDISARPYDLTREGIEDLETETEIAEKAGLTGMGGGLFCHRTPLGFGAPHEEEESGPVLPTAFRTSR